MKTVFCFGNEYIEEDNLALILADELKIEGTEFFKCYSPDFLMDHSGDLTILDVAKGIKKVEIIDDTKYLENSNLVSLHDFDLNFFLKLLKEMGKIKEIKIVAIPLNYDKEQAKKEVERKLKEI